jgi:hypothetical protein
MNLLPTVDCRNAVRYNWSLFLLTFVASSQHDRQCTYHVTMRLVRASIDWVEKLSVLHMLTCAFVALAIPHAVGMRHIVMFGLSGSSIFFHIISRFPKKKKKKNFFEHKMCLLILYIKFFFNFFVYN